MPKLSERLKIIASFVPQGKSICDVGTDHGYLPAALYLSGKYKKVTATDIREKPLKNARNNLERLGVKGVELVLCDGLSGVEAQNAEVVIIAGMGGDVISGIMENCSYKEQSVFILQPMTAADTLREYLAKTGFAVIEERAISENKKIYSVMKAVYDGKKRNLSPAQRRIGILKPTLPENIEYIKKQLRITAKCAEDLKNISEKREYYEEVLSAYNKIKKISEG